MTTQPDTSKKPRRLGRGLSGLLAQPVAVPVEVPPSAGSGLADPLPSQTADSDWTPGNTDQNTNNQLIPVAVICPNQFQPRTSFDEPALERLADSIRRSGLMQPVIVRRLDDSGGRSDQYELVAGERRWRAAAIAGLDRIPAIVTKLTDEETAEWALVENLQREDLNPMERAFAFKGLAERFGLSHAQIAERVGFDRSTVANLIRLTELEAPIREMIAAGKLSAGHGKALLAAAAGAERVRLAEAAAAESWSVRRLERAAQPRSAGAPTSAVRVTHGADPGARAAALADLEKQLGEHLGTKVRIATDASGAKGRLTIDFYGLDHFDGLLTRLGFASR